MMVIKNLAKYLFRETSILPLAIFRMAFGFLMSFSMFRFLYLGWIDDAYITPKFHFTYQYFNWITPLDSTSMHAIVILSGVSAFCIGLGLFYRYTSILFFFLFTYLELIEKSWYLNHYYFVSLIAFLIIIVPAHRKYSLDAQYRFKDHLDSVPNWTILIIKLQISCVYLFGGIAKLKSDWLIDAQPLKIWLKARTDTPLIGWLFEYDITPYIFSWSGMLYDLLIPFLLFSKKLRPIAYIFVVFFHIMTYALFNIGMFPWLMIFGSLIFISKEEWRKINLKTLKLNFTPSTLLSNKFRGHNESYITAFFIVYLFIQFSVPLRHHFKTNNVLWTENGFRFSWNVMVMEKNGFAEFTVIDNKTKKKWIEYPSNHLSIIQEKQMSFQPDMIWQFAQYLRGEYNSKGLSNISIFVTSKVSLNGRTSQTYIDPSLDLISLKNINQIYNFVKPLKN